MSDYEAGEPSFGQTAAQLADAAKVVHWLRINQESAERPLGTAKAARPKIATQFVAGAESIAELPIKFWKSGKSLA
jgi:hypothetical protein